MRILRHYVVLIGGPGSRRVFANKTRDLPLPRAALYRIEAADSNRDTAAIFMSTGTAAHAVPYVGWVRALTEGKRDHCPLPDSQRAAQTHSAARPLTDGRHYSRDSRSDTWVTGSTNTSYIVVVDAALGYILPLSALPRLEVSMRRPGRSHWALKHGFSQRCRPSALVSGGFKIIRLTKAFFSCYILV